MDGNGGTSKTVEATKVETVTPELARQWLAKNTRNRSIGKTAVEKLAKEIRDGRWRLTHQGIAFGADGELYDGQHRLHAVVVANVPVKIRVTRGLPPEARDAIDVGVRGSRKAQDVLAITDGLKLSDHDRAEVMVAHMLGTKGTLVASMGRVLPHELREATRLHHAAVNKVHEVLGRDRGRLMQSAVVGTLAFAWHTMPEVVLDFAEHYRNGANLEEGHPALVLRTYVFETFVGNGSAAYREDLSLRTFSALAAFNHRSSRKFLRVNKGARDEFLKAWREAIGEE